jgi:hypothetical protein
MNEVKNIYLVDLRASLLEKFRSADTLNYCNIIEYVKLRYDISVVNLAMLFNVNRATIYNYIDGKNDIPQKVQELICKIYHVELYKEVSELEYRSNFYRTKLDLIEKNLIENDLTCLDLTYIKLSRSNKKITYEFRDDNENKSKWIKAIREKQGIDDLLATDSNINKMIKYMSKNSEDYNNRLVKLISQTKNDDERLLMALNHYISNELTEGNLGNIVTNQKEIKKRVDEIVNMKDSLIGLDENDFKVFPKLHVIFKLKSLTPLNIILPRIEFQTHTIILNIHSRLDLRLSVVSEIIKSIQKEYGQEVDIVYGASINEESYEEIIDLFFID